MMINNETRHNLNENINRMIDNYEMTRENGQKPSDAIDAMIAGIGYDETIRTVAALVNTVGAWDQRISDTNRTWSADKAPTRDELAEMGIYTPSAIHQCHIDQLADAARKAAKPAEEEHETPEEDETSTATDPAQEATPEDDNTIKATFCELGNKPTFNPNHRKENHFSKSYTAVVFNGRNAYDAVILRLYETAATTYCCLWVHDNCSWTHDSGRSYYRSSTGRAGGYQYNRTSAAAADAIKRAGIKLSQPIGGRGDGSIYEAVYAIANAMWKGSDYYIHITEANA